MSEDGDKSDGKLENNSTEKNNINAQQDISIEKLEADKMTVGLNKENDDMDVDDVSPDPPSTSGDVEMNSAADENSSDSRVNEKGDVLDLTQKSEEQGKRSDSPDIIVLSDEDPPMMNGKVNGFRDSKPSVKLSEDELKDRKKLIIKLNEELRNEEMKLILLKKLRQSQQTQQIVPMKENVTHPKPAAIRNNSQVNSGTPPPPLVRGSPHPQLHSKSIMQHHTSHLNLNSQRHAHSGQSGHHPPPLMMGQRSSANHSINLNSRSGNSRSSPNVVMGYSSNSSQSQNSHHNERGSDNQQTPAQRQAAAKLALRKQLEKTLLQIPPPKPPPPEMHFIPNATNQEFICLIGLESVVNYLINDPSLKRPPPTAFICVQCNTDFTTVWKWDNTAKNGKSGGVICENCLTSNQKKAAKAEHTNRLKTAFVKALQQEQEIEQRMSQPSPPAQQQSLQQQSSKSRDGSLRNSGSMPHAAHHSLLQAHQQLQQISRLPHGGGGGLSGGSGGSSHGGPPSAHVLSFNHPFLTPQLYSGAYQVPPHSKASDIQRQYLLDMIPTPRSMPSIPQGNINWKM